MRPGPGPGANGTIKLLHFHDNYRPAYFGTYGKTSAAVRPRQPLGRDGVLFNYEYDSDDDWEDEPEGEEILSNDEDEQDAGDDEEDEDGFVVPHGYLSDDEGAADHDDRLKKSDCLADAAARKVLFLCMLHVHAQSRR
jgi:chromatin assembly factor 1 subunit A